MARYALGRVAQLVLVTLGVTLLIYAAVFAIPGDPIRALAGQQALDPQVIANLHAKYHLDEPLLGQYGRYLLGLLHGDLGTDFHGRSVVDLMSQRWPVTINLALTAWFFELVFGVALGMFGAVRHGKVSDRLILVGSVAVISIPVFVLAYTAQILLGVNAGVFPIAGIQAGWPMSYLLPALVLASFGIISVSRLVRASVIENLHADYVRTARASGLRTMTTNRHVLRNSMIPVVTYLAIDLGFLLGGTVLIEGVFNLPGIGQLLFGSIQQQQGTVVVGVATILVLIFLSINLVVDLLYGTLDPRIRHV